MKVFYHSKNKSKMETKMTFRDLLFGIAMNVVLLIGYKAWRSFDFCNCESTSQINMINPRGYQLQLEDNGAAIYDGDRYVGFLNNDSTQAFDQLMIKDNE